MFLSNRPVEYSRGVWIMRRATSSAIQGRVHIAIPEAYSQIAYGKLCARLFNYEIWWVRVMVEGWGFE